MVDDNRLDRLIRVAKDSRSDSLTVHQAIAALDEKHDGEPVTRIALLVDDPTSDTWPAAEVHRLREALERKAVELDLPEVSLTLVPESERELFDPLAG